MARTLRMPSEAELPEGAVRLFVEEVFGLYREAHRPTLRHVSEAIRKNDSLSGTASPETIRRMLLGLTVPSHWSTVDAVVITLCELAGIDPDQGSTRYYHDDESDEYYPHQSSRRKDVEQAWHCVLDLPDERDEPVPSMTRGGEADPWADDGSGDYSDEPPF